MQAKKTASHLAAKEVVAEVVDGGEVVLLALLGKRETFLNVLVRSAVNEEVAVDPAEDVVVELRCRFLISLHEYGSFEKIGVW